MLLHVLVFNGNCFSKTIRIFAKLALSLGVFLFIKVVSEDILRGVAGFWSGNMRNLFKRKLEAELVVTSMFLQIGRCMKMLLPCSVVEVFNK